MTITEGLTIAKFYQAITLEILMDYSNGAYLGTANNVEFLPKTVGNITREKVRFEMRQLFCSIIIDTGINAMDLYEQLDAVIEDSFAQSFNEPTLVNQFEEELMERTGQYLGHAFASALRTFLFQILKRLVAAYCIDLPREVLVERLGNTKSNFSICKLMVDGECKIQDISNNIYSKLKHSKWYKNAKLFRIEPRHI